jgi:hypothetical protein
MGAECGGPRSIKCGNDEWCSYSPPNQCGAQGQTGTCEKRPRLCAKVFIAVCGCDGKTYGNQCYAHYSGVSLAYPGSCKKN